MKSFGNHIFFFIRDDFMKFETLVSRHTVVSTAVKSSTNNSNSDSTALVVMGKHFMVKSAPYKKPTIFSAFIPLFSHKRFSWEDDSYRNKYHKHMMVPKYRI